MVRGLGRSDGEAKGALSGAFVFPAASTPREAVRLLANAWD